MMYILRIFKILWHVAWRGYNFRIQTSKALRELCKQPPKVSVVVPFYNEKPEFLKQCLASLAAQSYPSLEIIVVDDGSGVEEAKWLRSHLANKDNILLVCHHENMGLAAARNTGIANATGNWITFLDSDDFLTHHSITNRMHVALRVKDKRCAGFFGRIRQVPEDRHFHAIRDTGK